MKSVKRKTNNGRHSFNGTKGEAAVMEIKLPEVYIDTGSMISQRSWEKLLNDDQKKAALDAFFDRMDQNFSRNWQATYELISLAQEYEKYWRDEGFSSFEEFWRERGKFAFDQFRKLESTYHYAKQACPRLFSSDYQQVAALVEKLAGVKRATAVGNNGHRRSKSSAGTAKTDAVRGLLEVLEPEKQSAVWQAGFRARRSSSMVYRFRRIKRDAPKVAADVLAGKYIRFYKNGKPFLSLTQAEEAAGIPREKRPVKKTPAGRAVASVGSLSGMKEMRDFVGQLPAALRRSLKKALSNH